MSECALNAPPNADGSCLTSEHVSMISKYTDANTLTELKQETNCDDDICILEKTNAPEPVKELIKREALKAPTASFDHNHWLNNTEIDTVMSQLRTQFPGFAHGFIHMIDLKAFKPANIKSYNYPVFDAQETDFANELKYAMIQRGIISGSTGSFTPRLSTHNNEPLHSYGIVCNTDSSSGSGQHWFSIFISTDQKNPEDTSKPMIVIELFNSAGGGSDNSAFNNFWNKKAIEIAQATGLRCVFKIITDIAHQKSTTGNCGSYSLFYIYARLKDATPQEFNNSNKKITDYAMQKFRTVCFQLKESIF